MPQMYFEFQSGVCTVCDVERSAHLQPCYEGIPKPAGPLANTIEQILAGLVVTPEEEASLEEAQVVAVLECPSCHGPMTSPDGRAFTCQNCDYSENR